MPFDPRTTPLSPVEARVLATLMEKARTVPDSYPLTLNSLVTGCNQKSSRDPVMEVGEGEAQEALDSLRLKTLSVQISSSRSTRYEHNFPRGIGVPDQSAVLLALLMLRGPQTAGELRINSERWHRFADISSVEPFWTSCVSAAKKKVVRWSYNFRVRPERVSSAGPTCCAAPWMLQPCKAPPVQAGRVVQPAVARRHCSSV